MIAMSSNINNREDVCLVNQEQENINAPNSTDQNGTAEEFHYTAPEELTEPLHFENIDVWPLTGDVIDRHRGDEMFFSDEGRKHCRIDYVLVWKAKDDPSDAEDFENNRKVFRDNLIREGLLLEDDIQEEGRDQQYLKVHATVEVLKRYAEIMKIRMPMKELPQDIEAKSIWEKMANNLRFLIRPFELDPKEVPEIPQKFTCKFQRDKDYLFAIPKQEELFFSNTVRSRIVDYILRRNSYTLNKDNTYSFGILRLLNKGVYTDCYPLHEGGFKAHTKPSMRKVLYQYWAHWSNFYKIQPLDYVRTYFGEKIGLYFAWLGFYTTMLIPASILGLFVFFYGVFHMATNTRAVEACDPEVDFWMCPQCDRRCAYWKYSLSCNHVKASHLFDNGGTVFFAVFMSLWGTVFLEFWKRAEAKIQFRWKLMNFDEEEEPPRPEFLIHLMSSPWAKKHPITGDVEPFLPFWRRKVPKYVASITTMLFMVLIGLSIVIGVIVYRISVMSALHLRDEEFLYKNASIVTTATAACINLIFILILNYFYTIIAERLTNWECQRTQSEYDSSLTIKLYTLQFVNYYSSILYVAFFKGRFTGRPGAYNTFFGARQEECEAGGCLIELAIQLAIIFVGKQLIQNNIVEILLPRIRKLVMKKWFVKSDDEGKSRKVWEKDYLLTPPGERQLFYEYLEMLLQFGFVTIFVAAFPLAPVFALLNNVIEIRGDANKFVTQLRRPMGARAATIGIWYDILSAISRLAVITNAMIIAFTSGFVHRMVYQLSYSPDGSLNGFTNNSLSYFNVSDFDDDKKYIDSEDKFTNLTLCRYQGFREPPWSDNKYEYTAEYWHIVAAQFIFIFVFENFVFFLTGLIAHLIPDMPQTLRELVRRENYLTNQIILKMELKLAMGDEDELTLEQLQSIRRRVRMRKQEPEHREPDVNENESSTFVNIGETEI